MNRSLELLLIAVVAGSAWADDQCALCHEQATRDWAASPHARTMDDTFQSAWSKQGKKPECLVCHASRKDGQAGVSCESCHGAMKDDHPDKAKMILPVTSEVCQSCHSVTYGEWRVSAHGQKNIRCFDCHKMHGMQLRKDKPDEMCGSCHTDRLKSFSHATHAVEGLHCLSCHMPEVKGGRLKERGLGVRGHTFGVGAETCANCHRDMVHASHERASLEEEVHKLKAATPEKLQAQFAELEKESGKLRETVAANKRVFPAIIALAFLLGIFAGYALPHFRTKKPVDEEIR